MGGGTGPGGNGPSGTPADPCVQPLAIWKWRKRVIVMEQTTKAARSPARPKPSSPDRIAVSELEAGFGNHQVLRSISLSLPGRAVTAIIGPSGCGKSTFIRCINRLHEESSGAWARGSIRLDGVDLY